MGGARLEGEFLAEEPCYWLPPFKALLKCHLLKAFWDSSLAPWIKRWSWGGWLHPPANRPGLAGAGGHVQAALLWSLWWLSARSSLAGVFTLKDGLRGPWGQAGLGVAAQSLMSTGCFSASQRPACTSHTLGCWHVTQSPPAGVVSQAGGR